MRASATSPVISSAGLALAVALSVVLGGCGAGGSCPELGNPTGFGDAALLTVAIYAPPAMCQGSDIVPASATAIRTASGPPDAPLSLQLDPGVVFVQVRAYSDAAGTKLLAQGCSTTTIRSGATACLSLPVLASMDGGSDACTPITHSDGVGHTFLDCAPTGTFDEHLAQEACTAFTGDGALCRTQTCGGSDGSAVCSKGASDCLCWTFSGAGAGHVGNPGGGGCDCGTTSDPTTWS